MIVSSIYRFSQDSRTMVEFDGKELISIEAHSEEGAAKYLDFPSSFIKSMRHFSTLALVLRDTTRGRVSKDRFFRLTLQIGPR